MVSMHINAGAAVVAGWLGNLVDVSLKGFAILAVAGLAAVAMRRASAAARHLVWCLATTSLLALPVLTGVLPAWRVPLLPQWPVAAQSPGRENLAADLARAGALPDAFAGGTEGLSAAAAPSSETKPVSAPGSAASAAGLANTPAAAPGGRPWRAWLGLGWAIGALCVFVPLAAGVMAVWRLSRRAQPAGADSWAELARAAREQLDIGREVKVLRTEAAAVPMTWGFWRPILLLPGAAETWTLERRRMVLLHELAHVKRWDCLTQMLARLVCVLFWFNPLVWVAAWRMRVERERACDDLVLASGSKASEYADQLLQIAAGFRRRSLAACAAIAMARRSTLEGRLLAILDHARNRRAMTRWAVLAGVAVLSCLLVPVAMLRGGENAGSAPEPRHFVRLVVSQNLTNLTFQGQPTTWRQLPELLAAVPDREHTVLEWATENDSWKLGAYQGVESKLIPFVDVFGFEYLSYVGGHPLGSKGAATQMVSRERKPQGGGLAAPPAGRTRHFVRLVVGEDEMTFEAQTVTWDQLPALLEKVDRRADTVFELAVASQNLPLAKFIEAQGRAFKLVQQFGFEYLSDIGVHPLGSRGSPPAKITPAAGEGAPSAQAGSRRVGKLVSAFPEAVDLSTPESACAAWHRAWAGKDAPGVSQLSWRKLAPAELEAGWKRQAARDAEDLAVYLKAVGDAEILEVQVYREDLAQVTTFLPFPPGKGRDPYSARVFGRINGQWKNLGEDRLPDLESARANFEQKKEPLWQNFQTIAKDASAPKPSSLRMRTSVP